MFLQRRAYLFLFCSIIFLVGCTSKANSEPEANTIIVSPVTLRSGEEATLTVVALDSDGDPLAFYWAAERGTVPTGSRGPTVSYKAPEAGGLDTVTVTITDGKASVESQVNISIEESIVTPAHEPVIAPDVVQAVETVPVDSPEPPTASPTAVEITVTDVPEPQQLTVAITEVMANPCGVNPLSDEDDATWNEYIELYNYGTEPIDVAGWWITDGEPLEGNPDKLVAWDTRNPGGSFGSKIVTESTILQAGAYAVVLSPTYGEGEGSNLTPYIFFRERSFFL